MEFAQPALDPPFPGLGIESSSSTHSFDNLPSNKRLKTASCEPWNRESFFKRARTFKQVNWFSKPVEIGPYECARHGWVCVGQDFITCACCDSYLSVNLSNHSIVDSKQIERHFKSQLSNGHAADCPWRDNACPPAFSSLSEDPVHIKARFLENFKSWITASPECQAGVYTTPALDPDTRKELLKQWEEQRDDDHTDYFKPSDLVLLAACGWKLRRKNPLEPAAANPSSGIWVMECQHCDRQVALTSFDVESTTDAAQLRSTTEEEKTEQDPMKSRPSHLFPTDDLREPMAFRNPDTSYDRILGWGQYSWPSIDLSLPASMPLRHRKRCRLPEEDDHLSEPKRSRHGMLPLVDRNPARKRKFLPEGEDWDGASPKRPRVCPSTPQPADDAEEEKSTPPPPNPRKRPRPGSPEAAGGQKRPRQAPLNPPSELYQKPSRKRPLVPSSSSSEDLLLHAHNKRYKRDHQPDHRSFNPLEEHTYTCPYVRKAKNNGRPGWHVVMEHLPHFKEFYRNALPG